MTAANINNANSNHGDILISRFSALGDVAMTLAPIYDACLSNPGRRFILLTRKHPATLFINPPENLIIHAIDTSDYNGVAGIRRLYKELRREYNISAYADLHDVIRTRLLRLFFRLGGNVKIAKIDKTRRRRRRLTRKHHKLLVPLTPMGERYEATLAEAGAPGKRLFKSLFPDLPDPELFAKASSPKQKDETWIGIAPFAAHEGKVYPADLMQQVLHKILRQSNVKVFIFGFGDKESGRIEQWRENLKKQAAKNSNIASPPDEAIVNMAAKKIGLPAELALMAHCDVILSMDSANMHLATLAGTRCVSIWGATHPFCGFKPRGVNDTDILQLDMTCRPCSVFGNKKCYRGDYHCLHGISPDRIISTLTTKG